jgi:Protein of unknown function (DUF2786)
MRNRERRRAKQKARANDRRRRDAAWASGAPMSSAPMSSETVALAYMFDASITLHENNTAAYERSVAGLVGKPGSGPHWRQVVSAVVLDELEHVVSHLWEAGWQPADVARIVTRRLSTRHARMVVDVITRELAEYAPATIDERWDRQLAALGAGVWWNNDSAYLDQWETREGTDRSGVLRCACEIHSVLTVLPVLPVLGPLPGKARRGSLHPDRATAPSDQRMLDRVRGLLAKAESTEFAEEAEALTAKAQELMARHSIDYALLAVETGSRDAPVGIRIGIDNPYELAKSALLHHVSAANRCKATWSKALGFSTVLGFQSDLEAVELLYTSLLVQATRAMVQAGPRRDRRGRSSTRSFRQSFLQAYAVRIGQRLHEATEDASRAADDDRHLPVLAARDSAVQRAFHTMFPDATFVSTSIKDLDGWASGTAAADLATLHARQAVEDGDDGPADRARRPRRGSERVGAGETIEEPVLALR